MFYKFEPFEPLRLDEFGTRSTSKNKEIWCPQNPLWILFVVLSFIFPVGAYDLLIKKDEGNGQASNLHNLQMA